MFAQAVADAIQRQTGSPAIVSMQDCIYTDDGLESVTDANLLALPSGLDMASAADPAAILEEVRQAMAQRIERSFGSGALFTKRARGYEHEREFRFAWTVREDADEYLPLVCPAAAEFCERAPSEE
jgi:hypothetical protein